VIKISIAKEISKSIVFLFIISFLILIISPFTLAIREHVGQPDSSVDFLVDKWDRLDHKDQRSDTTRASYINNNYNPADGDWSIVDEEVSSMCLSYGASTTNDWFRVARGMTLEQYNDFVNGESRNGTNPRELQSIYYEREKAHPIKYFLVPGGIYRDRVTNERIPYSTTAYSNILVNPARWENKSDPNIGNNLKHTVTTEEYLEGFEVKEIAVNEWSLKKALEKYGVLYSHLRIFEIPSIPFPLHAVPIIGYKNTPSQTSLPQIEFWIHDSYDGADYTSFSQYSVVDYSEIFRAWAFYDPQWPFYHHDLRRTGFTLLKGDLNKNSKDEVSWTLDRNVKASFYDFPSIADVNDDGKMDILTSTSRVGGRVGGGQLQLEGKFFVLECVKVENRRCVKFKEVWHVEGDGVTSPTAPSIGDLDGDTRKEIVFTALHTINNSGEGNVYAFDTRLEGLLDVRNNAKWVYDVPPESGQSVKGEIGHTAIADIDLDGKREVIFADGASGVPASFQARLYILDHNGIPKQNSVALGTGSKGGSVIGAISIADMNGNGYPEIVLPSEYGILVYEYDPSAGQVEQLWNNSHAEVKGAAVISDVDNDNEYEIVYTTSNQNCNVASCSNKLYILDAKTGNEECSKTLDANPLDHLNAAPSVANLDSDDKLEIAIVTSQSGVGKIYTYEHNSGGTCSSEHSFPSSNIDTTRSFSDIADIDGDGNNDVVFSVNNGTLYILNGDLTEKWPQPYYLGGQIAGAPAIGDIDGDGVAEILAKRLTTSSSSVNRVFSNLKDFEENYDPSIFQSLSTVDVVMSLFGGNNTQPELDYVDDVYVIEEDFVNITPTATDADGDSLIYSLSSPLNSSNNRSGIWTPGTTDKGVYEILVEASDGNLTDSKFMTLTVYETGTEKIDTFSDGTKEKNITFTSANSKAINFNITLNNQTIKRSAFKIKGTPITSENNSFQEPNLTVIESNTLNNSFNISLATDKNFDTYYTAGAATGAIIEIKGLTVPGSPEHIVFHLKMNIYGGGSGRFAVYNYNTGNYEIVTSAIPTFNGSALAYYFDIYENSPLWTTNSTAFSMRVSDVDDYINTDKVRWYYRYLGSWASQAIYESEVKFEGSIISPDGFKLDVGNDGTIDFRIDGELHNTIAKINRLNNSNKNETISLDINTNKTRYISIPKDAILQHAELTFGNKITETLSYEYNLTSFTPLDLSVRRGEFYSDIPNGDGTRNIIISLEPINYFDGARYVPIDTRIMKSGLDYEVTKGVYRAYFKEYPSATDTIRVEKDGYFISLQPLSLEYNDDANKQKISDVKKVTGEASFNKILYSNAFGGLIGLTYEYQNAGLKEELVIQRRSSLPQLSTLSKDKANLDLDFLIDYSNDLDVYIKEELWDGTNTKTSDTIRLKKGNETIFIIKKPYAKDSNSESHRELLVYELKKELDGTHIIIKTPYSFLENATYPVKVDPTIGIKVGIADEKTGTVDEDNDENCLLEPNSYYLDASRSLITFPLDSLPFHTTVNITEAKVWLYDQTDDISSAECGTYSLEIARKEDSTWSCSDMSWSQAAYNDVIDTVCAYTDNTWYGWNVFTTAAGIVDISDDFMQAGFSKFSVILAFVNEDSSPSGNGVTFSTNAYLNITYDHFPNNPPDLVGCSDDYTLKNSNGSSVQVDLWDCYYDVETNASDAIFAVASESNTALIDCQYDNKEYITCGAPATGQTGFSDINISVDDGDGGWDYDEIRIYVREPGNVSIYINDTRVYKGLYWEYVNLDLFSDIENYLDICEEDSNGFCDVPITIGSEDIAINYTLESIDINYDLRWVDFTNALEDYYNNTCSESNCTIPLNFSLASEGTLNITDFQIFHVQPFTDIDQPTFSDATSSDELAPNQNATMTITIQDETSVSGYIFSWNESGAWINNTFVKVSNITLNQTSITVSTSQNITNANINDTIAWRYYANDTAGNGFSSSEIYTFLIRDLVPPQVDLKYPLGITIQNSSLISWVFQTLDPASRITNASLYTNGTDGNWSRKADLLSVIEGLNQTIYYDVVVNGTFLWNIFVCDSAPNKNCGFHQNNWTVKVLTKDLIPPTFSNAINDTGIVKNNNITMNITITDNTAIDNYTFSWNDTGSWINDTAIKFTVTSTTTAWDLMNESFEDGEFATNPTWTMVTGSAWHVNSGANVSLTPADGSSVLQSRVDSSSGLTAAISPTVSNGEMSIVFDAWFNNSAVRNLQVLLEDTAGGSCDNGNAAMIVFQTSGNVQSNNPAWTDTGCNYSSDVWENWLISVNKPVNKMNITKNGVKCATNLDISSGWSGTDVNQICLQNDRTGSASSDNYYLDDIHAGKNVTTVETGGPLPTTWYANTSKKITSNADSIISWRYYACDSAKNCVDSGLYNFTVGSLGNLVFTTKDSSENNISLFYDRGSLLLKATCEVQANCTMPTDDQSFIIKDIYGETVSYINSTGHLCIETGDCSGNSNSCNPSNDAFIIQNSSGSNVSYIDFTGNLCLTGNLIENGL